MNSQTDRAAGLLLSSHDDGEMRVATLTLVLSCLHVCNALWNGHWTVATHRAGSPSCVASSAAIKERRQQRWDAAAATLEGSVTERRRQDHRAHLAKLVGVYVAKEDIPGIGSKAEVLVAMQPDQGGRKMIFLDPVSGQILGFIELETLSSATGSKVAHASESAPASSVLRGMLVTSGSRGKGYARLFLSMWLGLCARAGVTPGTSRINKPLLALTLVRLGFVPLRGRDKPGLRGKPGKSRKAHQQPLAVEVSVGSKGDVLLYCSTAPLLKRLIAGFSARELSSQRLIVSSDPPSPRGRVAHIRVRYAPPSQQWQRPAAAVTASSSDTIARHHGQMVHAPLAEATIGGRMRISAVQGPVSGPQTAATKAEMLRLLTGRLEPTASDKSSLPSPRAGGGV